MKGFEASYLSSFTFEEGVYCNNKVMLPFEVEYLSVRKKENRVYEDMQVAQFPIVAESHSQFVEWMMRKKSLNNVLSYLKTKNPIYILDLGCGNGWFLHHIAEAFPNSICIGMDINKQELQQAARVFNRQNLYWIFDNVFTCQLPEELTFDCIILNGCLQYFEKPTDLIKTLQLRQRQGGEIHILDSPINKSEIAAQAAKARSIAYFKSLDPIESAQYFHHHTWEIFNGYKWQILYRPTLYQRLVNKLLTRKYNPFCWICITK